MALKCNIGGIGLPIDFNYVDGDFDIGNDPSTGAPTESPDDIYTRSSGFYSNAGALTIGAQTGPGLYGDRIAVEMRTGVSIFRIPQLDSLSPEIAAGFLSAQALVKVEDVEIQHQNYNLYTDTNPSPGGILLTNGKYLHVIFSQTIETYSGNIGIGLIGWKKVSGEIKPYIITEKSLTAAYNSGKYFAVDVTDFIASYLAAKNTYPGFSFYITGEGFDEPIISGDDAEAVAKNIFEQYSVRDLSFAGYTVADSSTVFEGTIDMYKYEWTNPVIGEIRCKFDPDEITINQTERFDYALIPTEV